MAVSRRPHSLSGQSRGWHAVPSFRRCRSQHAAAGRWHDRRPCARMHAAGRSRTTVVELLMLLQAGPKVPDEDQTAMVEQLWSMAYCVPGVLTASGGSLTYPAPPVPLRSNATQSTASGYTHMVHFRLGNAAQASAFLCNPRVKSMLTVSPPPSSNPNQEPICTRSAVLAFTVSLESELEGLFRRGPEYEQGEELVLLLQATNTDPAQAGQPAGGADAFVSELALLAQSSLAGAVQVSYGPAMPLTSNSIASGNTNPSAAPSSTQKGQGSSAGLVDLGAGWDETEGSSSNSVSKPPYVFMARFPSQKQLHAFRNLPPVIALWQQRAQLAAGGSGQVVLPLHAAAELVFSTAPTSSTSSNMRQ